LVVEEESFQLVVVGLSYRRVVVGSFLLVEVVAEFYPFQRLGVVGEPLNLLSLFQLALVGFESLELLFLLGSEPLVLIS
jgi:hypothetical protein